MGFNPERFAAAQFTARTQEVRVPDLAAWFDQPEEPASGGEAPALVWVVRGLTGPELAQVNQTVETSRNLEAVAAAITGAGKTTDKAEALQTLLGLGKDLPGDYVRRLEMLILGSVEPPCTRQLAVRLGENFPIEFYELTNTIVRLTGQGSRPGESNGSGATPASEPPSPSGTSTDAPSTSCDPTSSPAAG